MFQRKRIGLCRDSSKIGEPLMRIMGNSRVIGVGNIREFSAVITRSRRLRGIFDVRSSSGTQGGLQTQLIDGRCPPFDLAEGTSSLGGIADHRPFLLAQRIIDLFVPPQGRGIGQEERFNHKPSARERNTLLGSKDDGFGPLSVSLDVHHDRTSGSRPASWSPACRRVQANPLKSSVDS